MLSCPLLINYFLSDCYFGC